MEDRDRESGERVREREVGRTNTHTQTVRRPIEVLFLAVASMAMLA